MKIVPYRFAYQSNRLNEIANIFNSMIGIRNSIVCPNGKNCIFKIPISSLVTGEVNGYIHVKGNYQNDSKQDIINNNDYLDSGKIDHNKTPLNDYFFVFNFINEDYQLIGERMAVNKKYGMLYIAYEGNINILANIIHTIEGQFLRMITEILPLHKKNNESSPLNQLGSIIQQFEVRYQNDLASKGTGLCVTITPEILRLKGESLNNTGQIIAQLEQWIEGITEGIKGAYKTTKKVKLLGAKRTVYEIDGQYIVKNIPQHIELSEPLKTKLEELKDYIKNSTIEDATTILNYLNEIQQLIDIL